MKYYRCMASGQWMEITEWQYRLILLLSEYESFNIVIAKVEA